DEDREHDRERGPPLTARAPEVEGDPEWNRGERVSEVVDQVGEQRDAQGPGVDERLSERRQDQDAEAPRDRANARPRTEDRAVDKAVRVPVPPWRCACSCSPTG